MADPGFQYEIWAQRFPALASPLPPASPPTQAFLAALYQEALLIPEATRLINAEWLTAAQIIPQMNLLVAHLLIVAQRDPTVVGRITDAGQGSVSVATDYPSTGETAGWFAQTQPGVEFWRLTAWMRTARYLPGPATRRPALGVFLGPNVYPGTGGWGSGYGPWGGW